PSRSFNRVVQHPIRRLVRLNRDDPLGESGRYEAVSFSNLAMEGQALQVQPVELARAGSADAGKSDLRIDIHVERQIRHHALDRESIDLPYRFDAESPGMALVSKAAVDEPVA